ncbi:MAG: S8 family peptidase [Candidatus Sericytochromatia bacterium]|nr:S8 family peptidase [Candidatus Sericytochromatia bacterium]
MLVRRPCLAVAPVVLLASLLGACGAGPMRAPQAARSKGISERPVMQAKQAFLEAPSEVVVASEGPALSLAGAKHLDSFSFAGLNYHLYDVGQRSLIQRALGALRSVRGVRAAEPNAMVYALDLPGAGQAPDDEYYNLQFGLVQKEIPLAWRITTGDPAVNVAVVDTGVDFTHPDLKDRVTQGPDLAFRPGRIFNRKDKNGPMDDNGHGTHCAGIIGALTNNGLGIAGVAPGVKILAVKVLGARGEGTSYDVMKGVAHAITHGAKIVNMSLGGTATTSVERKFYETAVQSGSLIVAAAGNSADSLGFPAAYPGVLSVGATDSTGGLARFSNHDASMSVTAPGVGILSTVPGEAYAKMSGTSMASPFVAGVAALVWSKHPDWTAQQVKEHLEQTASDRGAPGVDPLFGHGEVNPLAALAN